MNKNELIDAAIELNQVFGLEPPISLLLNEEELICKLKDAMTLANEDDEFSQTTVQTLKMINPGFIDEWQGDGLSDGDDDWIRAGRKAEKARQDDQLAAKELEEMKNSKMVISRTNEDEQVKTSEKSGLKDEFTAAMHAELEVSDDVDRKHRCWTVLSITNADASHADFLRTCKLYDVTEKDVESNRAEYNGLKRS